MADDKTTLPAEANVTVRFCGPFFGGLPLQLFLDGNQIAWVTVAEPVSFSVTPGRHALKICRPWGNSQSESFSVEVGEHIDFECISTFWRDWKQKKHRFWWFAPMIDVLAFNPQLCLTRIDHGHG